MFLYSIRRIIMFVFGWERIIVSSGLWIVDFRTLDWQSAVEYMILIRHYCRKQSFVCTVGHLVCIWRLLRQEVPAIHPGQKGPDPLPVFCTGEAPPGRGGIRYRGYGCHFCNLMKRLLRKTVGVEDP